MSIEAKLKSELKRQKSAAGADDQLKSFRAFRKQLEDAGVEIRKERFSISLMERVGLSNI